jgi:hypothetical protein
LPASTLLAIYNIAMRSKQWQKKNG